MLLILWESYKTRPALTSERPSGAGLDWTTSKVTALADFSEGGLA